MTKEQLFKDAFDSIVDCDEDKAMQVLKDAEEMGVDSVELLTQGYSAGIKHLGDLFGRGNRSILRYHGCAGNLFQQQ
jgi:trimethylamine corrinoid protein